MRDCPTVAGSSIPLIVHRVSPEACVARQDCNYHKCHRCIFRGQAVDWEPDDSALSRNGVVRPMPTAAREVPDRRVEVPRPAAASANGSNGAVPHLQPSSA